MALMLDSWSRRDLGVGISISRMGCRCGIVDSIVSNVRRPEIVEEGSNSDEELLIHHEGILLTPNESVEPVTTL